MTRLVVLIAVMEVIDRRCDFHDSENVCENVSRKKYVPGNDEWTNTDDDDRRSWIDRPSCPRYNLHTGCPVNQRL